MKHQRRAFESLTLLGRRTSAMCAVTMCAALVSADGYMLFLNPAVHQHVSFLLRVQYASSVFVAGIFLSVGLLVWLFALDRRVAQVLAAFSVILALCFAALPGGLSADPPFARVSDGFSSSAAALSVPFLLTFLLLFPTNYFASGHRHRVGLLRGALIGFWVLCLAVTISLDERTFLISFYPIFFLAFGDFLKACYYLLGIVGIFIASIVSFRSATDTRTRQQFRLLAGSVIVSLLPVFVFAVIPSLFEQTTNVDGRVSSLALGILAVGLGYSVLRYQLLVLDRFVRRIAATLVGGVTLVLVSYLGLSVIGILSAHQVAQLDTLAVLTLVSLASPLLWRQAQVVTDRLFFPDVQRYSKLLNQPLAQLGNEPLSLDKAVQLLTLGIMTTFGTQRVAYLSCSTDGTFYRLLPRTPGQGAGDIIEHMRSSLVAHVWQVLTNQYTGDEQAADGFPAHLAVWKRLHQESRPLLLQELAWAEGESRSSLARLVLHTGEQTGEDMLIAPLKVQGQMIGLLLVGERADHQHYAGPDFDLVQQVIARYTEVVASAYFLCELQESNERLREKNAQINDALERLTELDRLKDEFISIAMHEVNTPLTAVQGYIALLRDYNEDEESLPAPARATFLEKADQGCDDLALLVANMAGALDVQKKAQQLHLEEIALLDVVERITGLLGSLLQQHHHPLVVTVSPDLHVKADVQKLSQIIRNVVANAIKYSPDDAPIELSASSASDIGEILLCVRDYGPGVPPSDQERLFGRFVRLERDMNSPVRGSGLGLYICRQLIEAMSGRIWIESSGVEGEGSRFILSLPLSVPSQATHEEIHL